MKHLANIIGLFGIALLSSCVPHNTCSSKDMIELRQGGFSSDDINTHCMSYKISDEFVKTAAQVVQSELSNKYQGGNQFSAPASYSAGAATCTTQYGECPMMQPGTNGAPCVCQTTYGQIPGVMR
jgi:hypothetical protein